MLEQQSATNKAAITVSSGKRINSPSDDPIAATQILLYRQQITTSDQFLRNADFAENRLTIEDTTLDSVSNIMLRIKELQVQAANSINGNTELKAIASEMTELLDEVAGLANSRDPNGDYIFSGFQSQSQPFSKNSAGNYVYNGDDGFRTIQIADGVSVQTSDSGFDVFGNIRRGNGTFYMTEAGANTGNAILKEAAVTDITSWTVDTYTIDFTVAGANTTYTISDSTPAVISGPTAYTPGTPISFNGVSIELEGDPANGDQFTVNPSTGQTIFGAIENSISAMLNKSTTSSGSAKYNNQIFLAMQEIDQASSQINDIRTKIGGRLNKIDAMRQATDDVKFQSQVSISALEDLDIAAAVTELEKRAIALKAAQASFARIQDLTVFNYISL